MSLISYVTKIHFAENVLEDALEAELEALDVARPLIVCDHASQRPSVVERICAAMPSTSVAGLFELSGSHAAEDACTAAAALYRKNGSDGVIAFGGVASMHLAKALAVRVSHPEPLGHYAGAGGGQRIRDMVPPLISIPTIANACAETTGVAIIVSADGTVISLASACLIPRVVICDPTLTLDLSPAETASSGMDALTHCVETYIAAAYNPPADGIARDGIRRVLSNLERAVADPFDLTARRELMAAALNGALAHQKGLGGVHAMSHALAGLVQDGLDHGAVNAVLLPLVLDFNAPAVAPRYEEIRQEFHLSRGMNLGDAVMQLRERIGLPASLGALGFHEGQVERAAILAASDYCNRTNPRHAAAADYKQLLRAAL